jgi:hypothetical protein
MPDDNQLTLSESDTKLIESLGDFKDDEISLDDRSGAEGDSKDDKKDDKKGKVVDFKFDFGGIEAGETGDRKETPRLKEISEKYPKLLEEFPEIRNRYYKVGEFTKIFPSIDAAREAAARVKTLEEIEDAVFTKGTAKELLTRVFKNDPDAFEKLSGNMLEDIRGISKDVYIAVITPILDDLILALHSDGEEREDENVTNAALIANMFVHRSKTLPRGKQPRAREEKREEKVDNYERERFGRAQHSVVEKVEEVFMSNLEKLVPKMKNEFIREALIDKIKAESYKRLNDDDIHIDNVNALWKRAAKAGFDDDSLKSIIRQVLTKLAREIPRVYAKFSSSIPKEENSNENSNEGENKNTPSRPESGKKIDWSRTTDMAALDGKYVYIGDK